MIRDGTPEVSVLMSVYNGEKYLAQAIESLLDQTFRNFEFVIIDDGSTDRTPQILSEYEQSDQRIVLVRNEVNLKIPRSLNRGLQECSAPIIAKADADDIYMPERLEKQYNYFALHPDVGLISSSYVQITEDEKEIDTIILPCDDEIIRFISPFRNCFCHPTAMFRRELVINVGGYNTSYLSGSDYELWSRILPLTRVANIYEPLVRYRVRPDSVYHSRGEKGRDASLAVTSKMLSTYVGRPFSLKEKKAIKIICSPYYESESGFDHITLRLVQEIIDLAQRRESPKTMRYFKRMLSSSYFHQSIRKRYSERSMARVLLWHSIRFDYRTLISTRVIKQLVILLLPFKTYRDWGRRGSTSL